MRAVTPSVQAEAETRSAFELTSRSSQWPGRELVLDQPVRGLASGTRSSASASTISARPSLVESEWA